MRAQRLEGTWHVKKGRDGPPGRTEQGRVGDGARERTKQAEFWPEENGQMTKAQTGEKHYQTCLFK